jgi:tetratricopeptide (TPR) repeat protein
VNRTKYLVGLVGLVLGFIVGFLLTNSINKSESRASSGMKSSTGAPGGPGQQAMMGQVQAAIDKAKANPNDFEAQVDVARMYNQIGRTSETAEYLLKAYEIDPAAAAKLGAFPFIGQWYFDQKKYDEAEVWFRRSLETNPAEADIYIILGETLNLRTPPEPDKAIQELEHALKLEPKNSHALIHLIDSYLLKSDARLADQILATLREAEPTNQKIATYEGLIAELKAGKQVSPPGE